ncbi:hypothetical protein K437DRAFT_263926 [Tilletiaria anomala UBC 951]|uniref:Uncharacterized protein n=1 Tax=Tilletiaria anomala (strain ATCC 24038 / CBS 436.72 / UBC 951) TaxID=1037660 RepID=A0A066VSJ7_TILAU|nr:uncharacterized protein K437DRAFT_263926 [Tilletiaria anomala UBC 951]KDN41774.1 hypothetical protein K437DRAFT_263926 [Tilletiaria anomala UBC 951]
MSDRYGDGRSGLPVYVRFCPRDIWFRLHIVPEDTITTVKRRIFDKIVAVTHDHMPEWHRPEDDVNGMLHGCIGLRFLKLPHTFVATAPGISFHRAPSSIGVFPPPGPAENRLQQPRSPIATSAQSSQTEPVTDKSDAPSPASKLDSTTPRPLALDVFGEVLPTMRHHTYLHSAPPSSVESIAQKKKPNAASARQGWEDPYLGWTQLGLPGNREALEREQEAAKALLPSEWTWTSYKDTTTNRPRASIDSCSSSTASSVDIEPHRGKDAEDSVDEGFGGAGRTRSGTITAASSAKATGFHATQQQQQNASVSVLSRTVAGKLIIQTPSNISSDSRKSSIFSSSPSDFQSSRHDGDDSLSSIAPSDFGHRLRGSLLRRDIKEEPGHGFGDGDGEDRKLEQRFAEFANEYVICVYSDGRVLDDWITVKTARLRRYDLLEVQYLSAHDCINLPREVVFPQINPAAFKDVSFFNSDGTLNLSVLRKLPRPVDDTYLQTYWDGWIYVFKRRSEAAGDNGNLGVWKLRRLVIHGGILAIYRPKQSLKRPPEVDEKNKTTGTWSLSLLSSTRSQATGVAVDPPLYSHATAQTMPRVCLQLRFDRKVHDCAHLVALAPSSPTFVQSGVGSTSSSRGNTVSGIMAGASAKGSEGVGSTKKKRMRPASLALRCLTTFDHISLQSALQRELDRARESAKSTSARLAVQGIWAASVAGAALPPADAFSSGIDYWRRKALCRTILSNRSGMPLYTLQGRRSESGAMSRETAAPTTRQDDEDTSSSESEFESEVLSARREKARMRQEAMMNATTSTGTAEAANLHGTTSQVAELKSSNGNEALPRHGLALGENGEVHPRAPTKMWEARFDAGAMLDSNGAPSLSPDSLSCTRRRLRELSFSRKPKSPAAT